MSSKHFDFFFHGREKDAIQSNIMMVLDFLGKGISND